MDNLKISFSNDGQRQFYFNTLRNQLFSGGFNNGKTYIACLKVLTLLTTFPGYRVAICRQTRVNLMKTTYQTFFKLCPRDFYVAGQNLQEGYVDFKNGSRIYLLHLDLVEEDTLRGLEVNSVLTDQAEEISEKTYDILDARIGRWDEVTVPQNLLTPDWPINQFTGKRIVPSYHLNLCNPDTQFHFLYRHYHPDSLQRKRNHFYVEGAWDEKLGSIETYQTALARGEEYVNKFVRGQWGISNAQIHRVESASLIDYSDELMQRIKSKGNLYRILDHGDASPTCCLWCAVLDGNFIFFREYYVPNKVISEHRKAINELSGNEAYSGNYADPSIFRKSAQKDGGFWTVADEYLTKTLDGKSLHWIAADNNEFATRNRINELLRSTLRNRHLTTGETPAPGIFFIKRSDRHPFGCYHSINELGSQRRKLLGYTDGTAIYSDDRESSIADHAYDCIRYMIGMHGANRVEKPPPARPNSFAFYKMLAKRKPILAFGSSK